MTGAETGESVAPVRSVSLRLPYDPHQLPGEFAEEQLVAVFWDGEAWVNVDSVVDRANQLVEANPDHFSMWTVEARNTLVTATLEVRNPEGLYAGDPIHLRIRARSLVGDETPDVDLLASVRYLELTRKAFSLISVYADEATMAVTFGSLYLMVPRSYLIWA